MDDWNAQRRADQLVALADPDRLTILSIIAARQSPLGIGEISEAAGLAPTVVEQHVSTLVTVDLAELAETSHPGWTATADALIHFGRLITVRDIDSAPDDDQRRFLDSNDLPPVLERMVERLSYRFAAWFSRESVARLVSESYTRLAARARIQIHLVSLTEKFASDRLSALAVAEGHSSHGMPEVLFVCTQNAGRSQMAAAFLRAAAGSKVHVRTAGTRPAARIGKEVTEAMAEVGISLLHEFPKPLTDEVVRAADIVVTMGCGDSCPVYPGRRYMNWEITDPVGQPMESVRAIRDDLELRVQEIIALVDARSVRR